MCGVSMSSSSGSDTPNIPNTPPMPPTPPIQMLRSDDNMDTIMKRFDIFEEDTMPIVNMYRRRGRVSDSGVVGVNNTTSTATTNSNLNSNFIAIDSNDSVDVVYSRFESFLKSM